MQLEFMRPLTACMLSERRSVRPFGLKGGGSGAPGLNLIVRKSGHTVNLGAKNVALFEASTILIKTIVLDLEPHQTHLVISNILYASDISHVTTSCSQ